MPNDTESSQKTEPGVLIRGVDSLRLLKAFPIILDAAVDEVREQVWPLVSAHPDVEELVSAGIELLVGPGDIVQNVLLPDLFGIGRAIEGGS